MAGRIGHNSGDPPATRFARDQLRAFIERVERLEEEKKELSDDIRGVYAEAKGSGFDVKALRAIVRMRRQDADERREHEALVETYLHALGMLADTPLGRAAAARDLGPQVDLEDAIAAAPHQPVDTSDRPFGLPDDGLDIPPALDRRKDKADASA